MKGWPLVHFQQLPPHSAHTCWTWSPFQACKLKCNLHTIPYIALLILSSYGLWFDQLHLLQCRHPLLWWNDFSEPICPLFCWWAVDGGYNGVIKDFTNWSDIYSEHGLEVVIWPSIYFSRSLAQHHYPDGILLQLVFGWGIQGMTQDLALRRTSL